MTKRMVIMLVAAGVVLAGVFGFVTFRSVMIGKFLASQSNPPQTVSTTEAGYQEWQSRLEAVGTLRAVNGADLAPEVAGIVEKILFNSGDDIEKGAVLVQLRAEDDIAKLHSLEATAGLAETTYKRDRKLVRVQAVSQATLDTDAANLKNAKAQVEAQKAVLAKKTVRAPFAGHLGIRAVDVGQYVNAGTTLVTLQALDPIYVDFSLPQQNLDEIKIGQAVAAKVDTYPDKTFTGKIQAVNSRVDTATRNVQIRATLDNPSHTLLPGMYATVDIEVGAPTRHITLPQTAITYNPYGSTVFIADEKGKDAKGKPQLVARQTFVTTGATRGDQVAVLKGVKEGEKVVTAGQMKLRNGTPLIINNEIQPADNPHPTPVEQ